MSCHGGEPFSDGSANKMSVRDDATGGPAANIHTASNQLLLTQENLARIEFSTDERDYFIHEYVRQQSELALALQFLLPAPGVSSAAAADDSESNSRPTKPKRVLTMQSKDGSTLSGLLAKRPTKRKLLASPESAASACISPIRSRKKDATRAQAKNAKQTDDSKDQQATSHILPCDMGKENVAVVTSPPKRILETASRQAVENASTDSTSSSTPLPVLQPRPENPPKATRSKRQHKDRKAKTASKDAFAESKAKRPAAADKRPAARRLPSQVMESRNVMSGRISMPGTHRLGLFNKGVTSERVHTEAHRSSKISRSPKLDTKTRARNAKHKTLADKRIEISDYFHKATGNDTAQQDGSQASSSGVSGALDTNRQSRDTPGHGLRTQENDALTGAEKQERSRRLNRTPSESSYTEIQVLIPRWKSRDIVMSNASSPHEQPIPLAADAIPPAKDDPKPALDEDEKRQPPNPDQNGPKMPVHSSCTAERVNSKDVLQAIGILFRNGSGQKTDRSESQAALPDVYGRHRRTSRRNVVEVGEDEQEATRYSDLQDETYLWDPDTDGAVFDHYDENTAARAHCSQYMEMDVEYPDIPVYNMGNLSTYDPQPLENLHHEWTFADGSRSTGVMFDTGSDVACYNPTASGDYHYAMDNNLLYDNCEGNGWDDGELNTEASTDRLEYELEGPIGRTLRITNGENPDRGFSYPRHRLH
ncbi:hypothetical protein HDU86_005297 [Geranomyces michiganensis]|nr:hypothetical protein HDU86_005297 [Geranomyces michiganensis]